MKKRDGIPRRVTMKDIAVRIGVSVNTVSKALANKPDISLLTKERVFRVARELGYNYEIVTKSWTSGATHVVGLIVSDSANPFFAKVVKGVETTLHQQGYALILCNTDEDYSREKRAVDVLVAQGIDGVILTPAQSRDEDIAFLLSKKTPFVLLGRHFSTYNVPCVISSDRDGAYKAVDHLLRLGHRRILFLNALSHISSAEERLAGYRAAYEDNGIESDLSLIRSCEPKMESTYNELKSVLLEGLDFSAIFTFSDLMMLGVVRLLHERGIPVPERYSLIGFDDIDFVSLLTPPLTTVLQDTYRLGSESASLLVQMIRGHQVEGVTRLVPTKLVIRGSTARHSPAVAGS